MAHDSFYDSMAWRRCRVAFMRSKCYVCERCGGVATICHHKKYITADNVNDPNVTLNWDNLESLCHACHNREHMSSDACAEGISFDANGGIVFRPPGDENS